MTAVVLKKWGNSLGLCLPATEMKAIKAYPGEKFELSINKKNSSFTLRAVNNPQAEWLEAFNKIADTKEDPWLLEGQENEFDRDEWVW